MSGDYDNERLEPGVVPRYLQLRPPEGPLYVEGWLVDMTAAPTAESPKRVEVTRKLAIFGANAPTPEAYTAYVQVPVTLPIAVRVTEGAEIDPSEYLDGLVELCDAATMELLIRRLTADPRRAENALARDESATPGSERNPILLDPSNPASGL